MQRFFPTLLLILIISFSSFAQEELTLEEAITIALNRNSVLNQNKNTLETYESSLLAAYGNFLPTINASGSWDWQRSQTAGSTFNIGGAIIPVPPSTTETRSYGANVNANWTLFDGLSNFASLSQAKNDQESAQLLFERLKQQVVFQTINLYYNVVETKQLLRVREEDVIQQEKNLETIEERNRLGSVTIADVYQQQVQLGNSELEVIRTSNLYETLKSEFLYYLGLDVLADYELKEDVADINTELLRNDIVNDFEKISELVTVALERRMDYKSKTIDLESAYDEITIARSGHFPSLTGNLGYNSFANSFDNLFDNNTYSVGLTLSVPIFSGFRTQNRVEIAEVFAENTEIELTDLERQIKQNIQQAFLNLQAAQKELLVSEKNVAAAEENLKIERERYNLGAGKLLDVLIVNTAYTNALVTYITSQFNYITLREELKYQVGILEYNKYE